MAKFKAKGIIALALASTMMFTLFSACNGSNGKDENVYTVTLNYNDSVSRDYQIDVPKGEQTALPAEPFQKGYSFAGWYTEATGGEEVSFPLTPAEDMTIYAHWTAGVYDVTFDNNYEGATTPFAVKQIEYKTEVTAPDTNPTREGFTFRYWSVAADSSEEVAFPYLVTKNVSFYACWLKAGTSLFDLTIKYNDGATADKHFTKADGETLTNKEVGTPKKPGYDFVGWALDEAGSQMITLDTKNAYAPKASGTIYAIWKVAEFKITYKNNNNDAGTKEDFSQVNYVYGTTLENPGNPTRKDYTFAGWYTLPIGGEKLEFPLSGDKAPTKASTYYAHWTSVPVTTDIFDAEYVYFDPSESFPGFSGSALGKEVIAPNDVSGIRVDNYPTNPSRSGGTGYYVTYLYKTDAQLVFNIRANKAMTATLKANMGAEIIPGGFTIAPSGEFAFEVKVNGTALNYSPITITGPNEGGDMYKSGFKEYSFGTVNLKEGDNVITLRTANANKAIGGTTSAVAPMFDYIKFEYEGSGALSWSPIYDNLDS